MNFSELSKVLVEQGPLAVVFIVLLLLFYKLIWQVWTKAMDSKDREIERLLKLLETYHGIDLKESEQTESAILTCDEKTEDEYASSTQISDAKS